MPKSDSLANQSSDKLLALMEFLAMQDSPLRLSDIAAAMEMNASTVSRFLTSLINRGYAKQEPETGRYQLTYKICEIAYNLSSKIDLSNILYPVLREIAKASGCRANLITRYSNSCIYLKVVAPADQILLPLQRIGKIAPLYCTGAGKLLLQEFSEKQFQEYISQEEFIRYTSHTIMNPEVLRDAVEKGRINGYAIDDEECELGVRCLAFPVYDYTQHIVAVISISGSVSKLTDLYIAEYRARLKPLVAKASDLLGYHK